MRIFFSQEWNEVYLNSNWKSSKIHVLPKVHKSKKIIEEINENNNICLNMPPPENLKGRTIVGGPNCPTQRISGLLGKNIFLLFHVWKHI